MAVVAKGKRAVEAARRVDRLATEGMLDHRYEKNMYGFGGKFDPKAGPVIPMKKVADARSLVRDVYRAEHGPGSQKKSGTLLDVLMKGKKK